jgi:branched-chain amino acid transport system permease protein
MRIRELLLCTAVIVAILLPIFYKQPYLYFALFYVLYITTLAIGWNVLAYCGYINFGVGAFIGVATYISAFLIREGVHFLVAIASATVASGLLGLLLGLCTFRLGGSYFALASLGFTIIFQVIVVNSPQLGGGAGLYVPRPSPIPPYTDFMELLSTVMVVMTIATALLSQKIYNARIGRGLLAIKDDERAAMTFGIPVFKLKLVAGLISSLIMGLAASMLPVYVLYIEPYSLMSLEIAVIVISAVYVGGIGTPLGPVIGGIILGTLTQTLTVTISSEYNLLLMGVLLMTIVIFAPEGVTGLYSKLYKKVRIT